MRLLFVANFAADTGYAWDTIERVFRRVGERLVVEGHEVTVAYAHMPSGPSVVMKGAPFRFMEFPYDSVSSLRGLLSFIRLLRIHRIDALYLTDRPTAAWQYILYRAVGVRSLIVHDRTSGNRSSRSSLHWWLKLAAHRSRLLSADCCIAISKFVRDRLVRVAGVPNERVHLVYNGIEVMLFGRQLGDNLRVELGVSPHTPVIFSSGRAQEYKGIHVLIDAAGILKSRGLTDVVFVYCGDGPYLDALRERAAAQGLANFLFLGKRKDIARLLPSATVSVVPSLWAEAFGLTVVESMASAVPVIASRCGGIPELLADGGGILVEPGDAPGLAHAIECLLANKDLRNSMRLRGQALARAKFSVEVCANNLHSVISAELSRFSANGNKEVPRSIRASASN